MATTTERPPATAGPTLLISLPPRRKLAILGAILLTLFLASLDQTVVGTALPRIVTDLNGASLYAWVVTAYLLTSTVTVPIYGKFSDVFGRKEMLIIGVCLFLAGSWLSGASQDMNQLIAFRAIQGLGAGALFPIVIAIIGDLYSPRERGRFQGLFGAVFALSFIVGPFIGGWITDHISWHWVFYVNVPFGVASLVVLATVLPSARGRQASIRDLDYIGIVLFTAGVVPFMLGLTNKGNVNSSGQLASWTDGDVGGFIIIGLVILAVFLYAETRAKEPIIPLDLFKNREYAVSMAAVFAFGIAMFAAVIFMPRFYQTVRGVSATASGYYIWPLLVGLMGSSIGTGLLISRLGRYKWLMTGGAVLMLVGGFLMTHITAGVNDWVLWAWMLILGLGIGPAMAGYTVVVQNAVDPSRLGVATSTLTFLRQIGASVGLAAGHHLLVVVRQPVAAEPRRPGRAAGPHPSARQAVRRPAERRQRPRSTRAHPAGSAPAAGSEDHRGRERRAGAFDRGPLLDHDRVRGARPCIHPAASRPAAAQRGRAALRGRVRVRRRAGPSGCGGRAGIHLAD